MLSPTAKRNISRIIPFAIIWYVFSLVYSLLERGLLGKLDYYPTTGNPYHFGRSILITSTTALVLGILVGTSEVLYLSSLFQQKSFMKKGIYKTLIYLGIIIFFLLVNVAIYNAVELNANFFDPRVMGNVQAFFMSYSFWGVEVYIAAIIGVSLFYSEVSDNLGQSIINNFFTGKYHTPKVEERIFMFLDMKSSTTIAEHIGHVKYFEMLKEYYSDLSGPIVQHSGEIYQYVGDEIVVSWSLKNGLKNNNCVQCFFAIKAAIRDQANEYQEHFGLVPDFKAGIHLGKVTTGEIGVIKKEIIFTGDVLNTTARIQGLCNVHKVDLLVSDVLIEKLNLSTLFNVQSMGENELRGRDEKIRLSTIAPSS